ncbi:ATP-binding cassette domain-containing protein [Pseudorhodobacter sp. E13]|uniref:ABC transporter ATP-binding protein n=1 Tax=Pseudorhodobacter sp. E13 TaxID=2487931 RepID=UPI000F8CF1F6|nr:ATP-binding cassette domain-containing protein [Pseudorhodobacter sp. E13]RUS59252.1 ATP-binding cassette domain-containing protein [Pseudorhodobacter sp. E13]
MVGSILPLALEDITLRRAGKVILGPLSWVLDGAGITVVMGPNGSGKTSFLRAMHGLERVNAGRIAWAAPLEAVRARQAFVFQTPILMRRSVVDCIAYPLRLDGVARKTARARAAEAAAKVGLGAMLEQPAQVLSGGEKQKLALARALVRGPELLFLDEPCANLDGRATREIEAILRDAREGGTRIVMSTHDHGQARRLADDILFLYNGRLVETGPKAVLLETPTTPEMTAFINGELLP